LRVCDPAVGSGHFLVSALNEILAIKHDLGILTDRNGKWLRGYELEISNDYLITSYDGELLEYNPNNTESRRVQEALFHEKQTIIENCLFGVDINPNSVKICRLRLWIELLKHTYYTAESKYKELETLPNIDINIKTGDSLLSRFKLDADLSQALKQSKWNIDSYKLAVNAYKNAKNYDEKHNLVALIQDIKDNFRTEIDRTHPLSQKLKKANDEHYNLLMQNGMYDDTPDERRAKIARKQKLQEEIAALTAQLEAIKNNKVYQNAFEWRFEFPEVLDSEGKFLGFDVVMGNPPYIDIKGHSPMLVRYYFDNYLTAENRINLYALMIERTWDLIKLNGFFSFIVPNSLLMNSTYSKLRNKLWTHVYEIIKLPDNIFSSGVKVETIIFSYQKEIEFEQSNVIKYKHNEPLTKIDPSIANSQSKNLWHINNEVKFNLYMQPMAYSLLNKLHDSATPIGDIADFSLGITPYDKHKGHTKEMIDSKVFHSEEKISDEYVPLIDGGSISKYYVNPEPVGYLKYGDWLGAPRERRFFTEPRVIVRQILPNSLSIFAASTSNEVYFNQIAFAIISKKLHPNYVSALLNSTLINFIHTNIYLDPEKVLFQKILIENCKKLPIKVISLEEQQPIIKLVNKIINAKKIDLKANTSEYETKLNNMIFQLYNITESDIKMIYALMKS
ncbi:MAG: type II restriction endonuclease, partial [Chitinophagia bacterium]|nr:type II restriction endonuclease [Chitinophagia bacterium]